MIVNDFIQHLQTLPQDLPVFVRQQESYIGDSADYWQLTAADIIVGDVMDPKTEKDHPAVLIGDERV